jgi:hypothetical protein
MLQNQRQSIWYCYAGSGPRRKTFLSFQRKLNICTIMDRACVVEALSQSWMCAESHFWSWSFRFLTLAASYFRAKNFSSASATRSATFYSARCYHVISHHERRQLLSKGKPCNVVKRVQASRVFRTQHECHVYGSDHDFNVRIFGELF